MGRPRTRYAKSGSVSIAYQVFGSGVIDLLYVPGWVSHIEYMWEEPSCSRFLERLGSFARVIAFDKRGTGLSDRDVGYPTLEQRIDDMRAVMAAADSKRAALFGCSEGGSACMLFAATYPAQTTALVTVDSFAKRIWSPDYPWAPAPQKRAKWLHLIETDWGGVVDLSTLAPSRANDPAFAEWWSAYLRLGASPSAALVLGRTNTELDIRGILSAITVPTLVLHRRGDRDAKLAEGEYIASRIPGAKFVALDGIDHLPWLGEQDALVGEIEEFLTGARHDPEGDPNIVGSLTLGRTLFDRKAVAASTLETTLDALAVAIVVVDAELRIVHANRAAQAMLAAGDLVRTQRGRLAPRSPGVARALGAAVRLASENEAAVGRRGFSVPAPRADGSPSVLHVLSLKHGALRPRLVPAAVAAVFVAPAVSQPPTPDAAVAALFDLTAAEARVFAKIAAGSTTAEAAEALGVEITTLKTHLAHVFAKTGTRRQADLVALSAALSLPIQP